MIRLISNRKRIAVAVCLLLLLGGIAGLGIALGRLWVAASAVRADLVAVESLLTIDPQELDLEQAVALLHTTRTDLERLQSAARPFTWLAPYLGWMPRYGPDIQAAPVLLDIALDLAAAGEVVVEPLSPLLNKAAEEESDQRQSLSAGLAALQTARPEMMAALSAVRKARTAHRELNVKGQGPRVQKWVERLDRYLPLIEQGIEGSLLLPDLLGANGRRIYLVLVQNEDELRAAGGFISGVAQVTVEGGSVLELAFEDSYAVDDLSKPYPEPPAPLKEYMLSELWLFRDSNWSPDYPTSAQAAIDLYTVSRDVEIDGVIALDQQAIRLLIEALGPLPVEGHSEPVTGQNVIQMARRAWDPGAEIADGWWKHRKDFMAVVLSAVISRLESGLSQADLIRVARAALRAVDEKHMLVYLEDREAAALVAALGWNGALLHSPGDYLMVVDTNMGFNKVNALIEESLEYVVDLADLDRPRATLIVRHRHPLEQRESPCRHEPRYEPTYEQMMERCYWDYLRVYVPSESQLVDATPHSVSGSELLSGRPSPAQVTVGPPELDHNVFGTFLLVRPAETLETRFEYVIPRDVLQIADEQVEYTLTIQKQPGTNAIPLRVQILLPPGAKVETSEPEPASVSGSKLEYSFALEADQTLSVVLAIR